MCKKKFNLNFFLCMYFIAINYYMYLNFRAEKKLRNVNERTNKQAITLAIRTKLTNPKPYTYVHFKCKLDPEVSRYLHGAPINDNIKGMHVKCIVLLCNLILIVSCRGFWDNSACYRQLIVQHNMFKRLCGLVLNTKSLAQTKAYDISGFPHRAYARNCDVGIIC